MVWGDGGGNPASHPIPPPDRERYAQCLPRTWLAHQYIVIGAGNPIGLGALVELECEGGRLRYFIGSKAGGTEGTA